MTPRPWLLARGSGPTAGERGQREGQGKLPLWRPSPETVPCPVSGRRRWRDGQGGGCGFALGSSGRARVLEAMSNLNKWFPQQGKREELAASGPSG